MPIYKSSCSDCFKDSIETRKMVAILAMYLFAVEVITMETAHRRFLVLQDTNGELQFKTACLGTDLCHRGTIVAKIN